RVGIPGQRDDPRAIGQSAGAFVVLFEHLGRLEILEEAGDLCEQLLGLPQARTDEQDQARIVNRGVKRDGGRRRRLPGLAAAIEEDPRRARAQQSCLPRVRLKFEPILHERDGIERMSQIEGKVKQHAPPRREALRSNSLPRRRSLWPPATPPGGRRQRLPPVPRDSERAPGSAPRATAESRVTRECW